MTDMTEKVAAAISRYHMLSEGERVIVGLSGGADSVSLSFALKELGYDVLCVHVNHCLRGKESDGDEAFCRELCQSCGFGFKSYRVDVKAYCAEHKESLELGARRLRYRCFEEAAGEYGIGRIATAHTLSDCFETAMINLIRGCGIKGISGIPPVRGCYVRPLIECSRADVERYLEKAGIGYVTDSTNLIPDCTRNIIRLQVMPVLESINPSLYKSYLSTSRNLRLLCGYLEKLSADSIKEAFISDNSFDAKRLAACGQPVSGMAVSELMKRFSGESSSARIDDILDICDKGGSVTLAGGVLARSENGILSFEKPQEAIGDIELELEVGASAEAFGKRLSAELIDANNVHRKFTNSELDYDKLRGVIFVRNRRSGDRIMLRGRDFTSSVKTLFNAGVRLEERKKRLFVCDEEGIVFIEGFGCAERVSCGSETKRVVRITVENLPGTQGSITVPSQ